MESYTYRHFFHHGAKDANKKEIDACHLCQIRSYAMLNIANDKNNETLPHDYRFIGERVPRNGVQFAEEAFRSGCSCAEDSVCESGECACLADIVADKFEDSETEDMLSGPAKLIAYHVHGAKKGLLRSRMLDSKHPIYECHSGCSCSKDCPNRVVERGRTVPLEIFHTGSPRGWGVRSWEHIKKGQFIDLYLGEILTSHDADLRRRTSVKKDIYLFALDKFTDKNSLDERLRGDPLEVDGEFMSGPTRFVNHCCDPNMRIFARVGDHADKHVHDLALFAIKDIKRGEELTFDYVDGGVAEGEAEEDAMNKASLTRCLCGSKNCRGYLCPSVCSGSTLVPIDSIGYMTMVNSSNNILHASHLISNASHGTIIDMRTLVRPIVMSSQGTLIMPLPSFSVITPDPVSRFENRGLLERSRILASQVHRGRPIPVWRRCDTSTRQSGTCLYGEPTCLLVDEIKSKDGVPVSQYHFDFHQTIITEIWDIQDEMDKYQKAQAVASFVDSIPVRHVCGKFSRYLERLELPLLEADLFHELVQVANTLGNLAEQRDYEESTKALLHQNMGLEDDETVKTRWRLYDHLLSFALQMEQWRHYEMCFRPLWSFSGHPWIVAQLHVAVLLHVFSLSKEGCFKCVRLRHDYEGDKMWEEWFNKFPLPGSLAIGEEEPLVMSHGNRKGEMAPEGQWSEARSEIEEDRIVEYLGGIGQGACTSAYEKVPPSLRRLMMDHLLSRRESGAREKWQLYEKNDYPRD